MPGGIWDTVLEQYCAGERARPAWAMAELDYEGGGGRTLKDAITDLRTVLLVKQLSPQGVTEALKTGKMYVVRGQGMYDLVLDEFSVQTPGSSGKALMGETMTAQGTPEITVRAHLDGLSAGKPQDITLKLIRNGQVIRTETASNPFAMTFRDDQAPQKGMIFYRLELRSPQKTLVSNPIFVRFPI